MRKRGEKEFIDVPVTSDYIENSRGLGVADMAKAILHGGKFRANGDLAYHVLEAMHGFHDSSSNGTHYKMESTCERPELLDI